MLKKLGMKGTLFSGVPAAPAEDDVNDALLIMGAVEDEEEGAAEEAG